jgi:hypothetical protein
MSYFQQNAVIIDDCSIYLDNYKGKPIPKQLKKMKKYIPRQKSSTYQLKNNPKRLKKMVQKVAKPNWHRELVSPHTIIDDSE